MEENRRHIDELFREGLGNYTETPPPSVWDKVEQRLDATSRKPRPPFWWAWFVVLLIVVGAGGTLMIKHWMPSSGKSGGEASTPVSGGNSQPSSAASKYPTQPAPRNEHQPVIADKASPAKSTTPTNTVSPQAKNTGQQSASDKRIDNEHKAEQQPARHETKEHKTTHRSKTTTSSSTTAQNDHVARSDNSTRAARHARKPSGKSIDNSATDNNTTVAASKTMKQPKQKAKTTNKAKRSNNTSEDNNTVSATPKAEKAAKPKAAKKTTTVAQTAKAVAASAAKSERSTHRSAAQKPARQKAVLASSAGTTTKKEKTVKANNTAKVQPKANNTENNRVTAKPATTGISKKLKKKAIATNESKPIAKADNSTASKPSVKKQKPAVAAVAKAKKPAAAKEPAPVKKSTQPVARATEPPASARPEKESNPIAVKSPSPSLDEQVKFPSAVQHEKEDAKRKEKVTVGPDTSDNPARDTTDDEDAYTSPTVKKRSFSFSTGAEAGISAGYSLGFAAGHAAEAILAPYIQLSMSSRVNIRFSPSYRFGNVSSFDVGGHETYYNITAQKVDTFKILDTSGQVKFYNYHYKQTYDSLVISRKAGGATWAIDLPVTIGVSLGSGVSVFGGPVFSYGNTIKISAERQETKGLVIADSIGNSTTPKPPSYFTNLFDQIPHTGQSYAHAVDPNGADYGSQFRVGYTAGIRYSKGHFQGELSVQQSLSGMNSIDNAEVKKVYTQPYIHLTIGYRLWQTEKRAAPSMPTEED